MGRTTDKQAVWNPQQERYIPTANDAIAAWHLLPMDHDTLHDRFKRFEVAVQLWGMADHNRNVASTLHHYDGRPNPDVEMQNLAWCLARNLCIELHALLTGDRRHFSQLWMAVTAVVQLRHELGLEPVQ